MRTFEPNRDEPDLGHGRRPDPELEAARRRVEERQKATRRTKLHSFGLAGGRRGN